MFDIRINISLKKGTIQFSLIYPGHKMYIQTYETIPFLFIYVGQKDKCNLCWT